MPRKKGKRLVISLKEREYLERIRRARTEKKARVERAMYILDYVDGISIYSIAKKYGTNRPKVERAIHKALAYGVLSALDDLPGKGRKPVIGNMAKMWVLNIACKRPKEKGLPHETWTMNLLAKYIRENCEEGGFPELNKIAKGTVCKILSESNIKPHKIRYYLERTDVEFEEKMYKVLHIYKDVEIWRKEGKKDIVVVSYDEKPGVQAIGNVHPDLPPQIGKRDTILRDAHYKRHGTVSILSGIDLLTGKIHTIIKDRHRSEEFIEFLEVLDNAYPKGIKIKIILDNHSAHISKKTRGFLKNKTRRFEFVFTPKHGSWLNIIEVFFSKLTRCLLKNMRVSSKKELSDRILRYIEDLNSEPVIFKWKYKLDEL